jgi:imidazole glycerol-phosphate synthase subunit HisH
VNVNVAIIDYGMGNIKSVFNAVKTIESSCKVISNPELISKATHIILPGVGSFPDGINNLRENGWIDALKEEVQINKKPFLGICIGMQLLADKGYEKGITDGLGFVHGKVIRIQNEANSYRLPHIGWNDISILKKSLLFNGINSHSDFYFIHSYHLVPENNEIISSICNYGIDFAASIEFDNIFATQFHPEKSQRMGLKLIKNFLEC